MGRRKSKFKWYLLLVIVLLVVFIVYYCFFYLRGYVPKLEVMEDKVSISNYYIYGTNLSMEGVLDNIDTNYDDIDLVLYNGDFYENDVDIIKGDRDIKFSFGDEINKGLSLENIDNGVYYVFIRVCYNDEEGNCNYNYYVLDNETGYDENVYYTVSNTNKKIVINSSNDYGTMMFEVSDNNNEDIYDIVIDPGHGGIDSGTVSSDGVYVEKDLTMKMSRIIYDRLTDRGLKVRLTREEDSLDDDEYFEEYNVSGVDYVGRAVIPRDVGAKYVFSIHLNGLDGVSSTRGLEIYTSRGINYDFVEGLVNDILDKTDMVTSSKETYKVSDGVYTHNFTDSEVISALAGYDNRDYERYDVSTNSNYLYMIRETGGIVTGAYIDDRNEEVGSNPYYDSNIGVEAYLLELGYLSNSRDLDYIVNNMEEYGNVIADYIADYILG